MNLSKSEIGLYALSGTAMISSLIMFLLGRKNEDRQGYAGPLLIMGAGLGMTGAALTTYRRFSSPKRLPGELGLAEVERVQKGGFTLRKWGDPEMGVEDRVQLLQGLVAMSNKDPTVRKRALEITHNCEARDDKCEARAIFDWVADPANVRYTGDMGAHVLVPGGEPEAIDTFQSARRTMEFRGGDCDDHAVLAASLANWNGFAAKFRITSNTGASWDHIYTMVGVPKLNPKKWIALDTTLGAGNFDVEPKRAKHVDFYA